MKIQLTDKEAREHLLSKAITQDEADTILNTLCSHCPESFHRKVLINLDFSDRDLSNVSFAGVFMENVNFTNTNCHGTSFYGAFLKNIDFSNANIHHAIFSEAEISHSNFNSIKASFWKKIYLHIKNF